MASPSIHRIERINYGLAIVCVLAGMIIAPYRSVILGLMIGSGLTCLNFYVLRRLVVKWTEQAATGKPGNAQLLMMPKMVGLMGAVAFAVLVLPIDVIAFVIGYSIFILSIVIETAYSAFTSNSQSEQNGHG